jgi:RHS repeat-associated protein
MKSLYVAASDESKTKLLFDFHGYPYREPAMQLLQARDRWMDTGTGTWLTADAQGAIDSSNLYAFCGRDPVNCVDPTGLSGWSPAAWGHWIDAKAKAVKRTVGAASIALSAQTGISVVDSYIDMRVGETEATLNTMSILRVVFQLAF